MSELETQIVAVSVYPDRARITRRGAQAIEAGIQRIDIAALPLSLDPASLRARGAFQTQSAGQVRLLGVDVRRVFYEQTPAHAIKELEDQIQTLEDEDQTLLDQIEALTVQAGFARTLAEKAGEQLARGVAFSRTDIAQGHALMNFIAQEVERTQNSVRQANAQRRELAKKLDVLRKQLQLLRGGRGRERYSATLEVDASAAGELSVDLIYDVPDAGWQPLYDIRFDNNVIELTLLGQITQRTGEDWDDIELVLSTARPALAAVLPELQAWYVDVYRPPIQAPVPAPARGRAMLSVSSAISEQADEAPVAAAAPQMFKMETPEAEVQSSGASVTFKLSQRAGIPADGQPHNVSVASAKFDPQIDYISVPKLAEFAYRRAKVTNTSELLLLPGRASLFVDGDYIGNASLKLIAPGEEFDLYLGVDDRVSVKRELKTREVDKKLLQDKRRLHYGYEIELRNLRDEAISIEVHDQTPVARNEAIKIKLSSADPKPSEESELNELTWKLKLNPGTKQLVRFDFEVEHPRNVHVIGLP